MNINEFNDLPSFSLPDFTLPDNLKTSDELLTHSTDYLEYGKTEYAKSKKIKNNLKNTGIVLTLSVTGLLSGSLILSTSLLNNTYLGSLPTLKRKPTFILIDDSLYYSLDVENKGNMNLEINLKRNNNTINKEDVSKTSSYLNKFTLDYKTEYSLSLKTTNNNDYTDENKFFDEFTFISNDTDTKSFYFKNNSFFYSLFCKNYSDYNLFLSLTGSDNIIRTQVLSSKNNIGNLPYNFNEDTYNLKIDLIKDDDKINLYETDLIYKGGK